MDKIAHKLDTLCPCADSIVALLAFRHSRARDTRRSTGTAPVCGGFAYTTGCHKPFPISSFSNTTRAPIIPAKSSPNAYLPLFENNLVPSSHPKIEHIRSILPSPLLLYGTCHTFWTARSKNCPIKSWLTAMIVSSILPALHLVLPHRLRKEALYLASQYASYRTVTLRLTMLLPSPHHRG